MKRILFVCSIVLLIVSCSKDLNLNDPDVGLFVEQLKEGTYDDSVKDENGQNLWLKMPEFDESHIPSLIEYARDLSAIDQFPLNPISSRSPYPQGRDHFILGECLLWVVEGIRLGSTYGSLDPYMIDLSLEEPQKYMGLTEDKILLARDLYELWWNAYKNKDWQTREPLSISKFTWF